MSSASCQRTRKPGSPSSTRGSTATGPIKATKSFGLRSNSPGGFLQLRYGCSSIEGLRKWRPSSTIAWTDKNAFGSAKEKKSTEHICRSASFDTITSSYLCGEWPRSASQIPYLCGDWPRSTSQIREWPRSANQIQDLVHRPFILTADKWTQTLDDWDDMELDNTRTRLPYNHLSCTGTNFKEIRLKMSDKSDSTFTGSTSSCSSSLPASHPLRSTGSLHLAMHSKAIAIPVSNQRNAIIPCQGSAEGFNQEIEKLVRETCTSDEEHDLSKPQVLQMTPDGHRAPIADLLTRRSADLHMPSGSHCHSGVEKHFQRIPEDGSPSLPIIPGTVDTESAGNRSNKNSERMDEESESPDPLIYFVNSSSERQTPEGCERVTTRVADGFKPDTYHDLPEPIKQNCVTKFHIPSERSAFCPLLKRYVGQQSRLAFSLSTNTNGQIEAQ